jgi:hypothetical protein
MRRCECGVGAAPAGEARNLALGRPRDPIGGHYDPSAGSSAGLGPFHKVSDRPRRDKAMSRTGAEDREETGMETRKRGPGDRNRRDGAPRGAHPSPRVPAPQGVDWLGAWRRSVPSHFAGDLRSARRKPGGTTAHPAPQRTGVMKLACTPTAV